MTTAVKMSNKARSVARSLAVTYEAYTDAVRSRDNSGIRIWGELLLKNQNKAGVELHDPCHLRKMIQHAKLA